MVNIWLDYYNNLMSKEGSAVWDEACLRFDNKDARLRAITKNPSVLREVISKTKGANFILIPVKGKCVRAVHGLRSEDRDDGKGPFTFGMNGLNHIPNFQAFQESKLTKPLRIPRKTGRNGSGLIPSITDFAQVQSKKDFKDLLGSQDEEQAGATKLSNLPSFFILHPFFFITQLLKSISEVDELAWQIIQICKEGYDDDDLPNSSGVTRSMKHCYSLLLFLWAVQNNLATVTTPEDLPNCKALERICSTVYNDLEAWEEKEKKNKSSRTAVREEETPPRPKARKENPNEDKSGSDGNISSEEDEIEIPRNRARAPRRQSYSSDSSIDSRDRYRRKKSRSSRRHGSYDSSPDKKRRARRDSRSLSLEESPRKQAKKKSSSRGNTRSPDRESHTRVSFKRRRRNRDEDRSRSRSDSRERDDDDDGRRRNRRRASPSPPPRNRDRRDREERRPARANAPINPRRGRDGARGQANDRGGDGDRGSSSSSDSDRPRRNNRGDERRDRPRRRSPSSSDDERGNRDEGRPPRRRRSRDRGRREPSHRRSRSDSRDRRRRSNSRERRRGSSPHLGTREIMTEFLREVVQQRKDSQKKESKDESRKSILSRQAPEQADLFRILSAADYSDENPKLNRFTQKLVEDRDIQKARSIVHSETKHWPGQFSEVGLAGLLTLGYAAPNINQSPGGFSIFFFRPQTSRVARTEEEKRMLIKSMLGDRKLDDAMIKYYLKADFYMARSCLEMEQQFQTCISFLDLLTTNNGIASEGYREGLKYIEENRPNFIDEAEASADFCARYMYLVDRIFQSFILKLGRYHQRSNPIKAAREDNLPGLMARDIRRAMSGFESGVIPNLPLPSALTKSGNPAGKGGGGKEGGGSGGGGGGKQQPHDADSPKWWSMNPNPQEGWCLPTGRSYNDFFDTSKADHKKNIRGWPRFPHHKYPKIKKFLCLKYQAEGKCKEKCYLAHIDPKNVDKEPYEAITSRFKEVYALYTKPLRSRSRSSPSPSPRPNQLPDDPASDLEVPPLTTLMDDLFVIDNKVSLDTDTRWARFNPLTSRITRSRSPSPKDSPLGNTRPKEKKKGILRQTKRGVKAYRQEEREGDETTLPPLKHYPLSFYEDSDEEIELNENTPNKSGNDTRVQFEESDYDDEETAKTKEKVSAARNRERIRQANQKDVETVGKYLPENVEELFVDVVKGADDHFHPPPWLLAAVEEIATLPVPTPSKSEVMFTTSPEALAHNLNLIENHGNDFEKFLASQEGTTLEYGSEFRPITQIEKVLGNHPNFPFFEKILKDGMPYHFTHPLTEEERRKELTAQLQRGNHQSAKDEIEIVTRLLKKDVDHGFAIPIQAEKVEKLKDAMVEPCGIAHQFKLQADGSRELAARLTHDLSYGITKTDVSVNSRVDMDQYAEMIYGWCLSRVIHYIVALRMAHPDTRIYLAKYDYSDAYRRVAHSASAAVQTILVVANVAYIMLRLAFGGSPNPPTWCAFSEMVTDLSNEIDLIPDWDPEKLHSPAQETTPAPQPLPDSVPFGKARKLAVEVPVHSTSKTDSFIDDLIRVFLDTPSNLLRAPHSVPLAIHVTSRPHAGDDEPIKRRDLLSAPKLAAEGQPVEIQVCLGWDLDTRRLLVKLPGDKFIAWTGDLEEVIRGRKVSYEDLDSLVGRLNHIAYLLPLARHFLPRLRFRLQKRRHKKQIISLSKEEIEDLLLWGDYMLMAHE